MAKAVSSYRKLLKFGKIFEVDKDEDYKAAAMTYAEEAALIAQMRTQLAEDGMTMLVVTHEMEFARNVSSKVMFMEDGKVVETAPSKQFFEQPAEPRAREFISKIHNS